MGPERQPATRLYLRLPVKIADQHQILQLHPKIVAVRLPRQKSRRWCIIEFGSQADLEEALASLKRLKVEGRRVTVRPCRPDSPNKGPHKVSEALEGLLA